jgi:hypothetical protein
MLNQSEREDMSTTHNPRPGWATTDKVVSLRGPAASNTGLDPLDRILAGETLYRFAFAYDEQQPEALADCFTADAVLSATTAGVHDFGTYTGREDVVGWLSAYWGRTTDQRRHIVTNVTVDAQEATSARVTAMLLVTAAEDATFRPVTAGLYVADLVKEADGVWRMSRFTLGFDASF